MLNLTYSCIELVSTSVTDWCRDEDFGFERVITLAVCQLGYAGACISSKGAFHVDIPVVTLFNRMDYLIAESCVVCFKRRSLPKVADPAAFFSNNLGLGRGQLAGLQKKGTECFVRIVLLTTTEVHPSNPETEG